MASLQDVHAQSYKDMPFDEFAKRYHQKFYSDLPFDQFLAKAAPGASVPSQREVIAEDPVKAEVRGELEQQRAKGMPGSRDGLGRQILQGMTFGGADEILAGASTPFEMIKRGTFNPVKGYEYAKAREDILMEDARKKGGALGTAAEVAGGVLTGGNLARAGMTFMKPGAGLMRTIGGMAADGAVYGGIQGAAEGDGLEGRAKGAVTGAAAGGVAGGALGAAAPVASAVGRNAFGWVSAARDPAAYAERQLARALAESGRTPQQIAQEVAAGGAAGQPFTVADALGNPGQRMLSTVARNPGEGRTAVVDFLEARQAGQGRRIAQTLAEAFDAPQTTAQSREALTASRRAAGNANYGAARQAAGDVDTSGAIQVIDQIIPPNLTPPMGGAGAENGIYATLSRARSLLTDGQNAVRDFDRAFLAKKEMDALIEKGGTVANLLRPARNALDDALAQSSQPYAAARDAYRQQSRVIDALDVGRTAATRGRTEDTTRAFGVLNPAEQQSFRTGYADPLIEQAQGGAVGVNKARPLTSDAARTELDTFAAPGRAAPARDAINRELRMFETRGQALGGSKTADNLADNAALGVNPEILVNLLQGNLMQAGRSAVARSTDTLSGNTAAVRNRLAEALLRTDNPQLQTILERTYTSEAARRRAIANALRGVIGGTAAGAGNVSSQQRR